MQTHAVIVTSVFLAVVRSESILRFPVGFKFGVATSAYQVEGGWNESDKGISVWDHYTHTHPELIADGTNGDVSCDSYHKWRDDVDAVELLGVSTYRFSVSWPRVLPDGLPNRISEVGSKYYSDLIDELLDRGIEPIITMYHWDLPQSLQDLGGFFNPLIADWFEDYARVLFDLYGSRVKTWLTINEPVIMCDFSINTGLMAPGVKDPEHGTYLCSKNVLLAHARAWRLYDKEYKPKYHGRVSFADQLIWIEEVSNTPEDLALADLAREFYVDRYVYPVYSKTGGWPPRVQQIIAKSSELRGHVRSRLPEFTEEEIELVKGTYDFYALNHYTSRKCRLADVDEEVQDFPVSGIPELNVVCFSDPSWEASASEIMVVYPEGIRKQMNYLKRRYGDLEIVITECGYSGTDQPYDKAMRYYRDYLHQVWLSINVDNINVTGFTAWSLLDNFEWFSGYSAKFGLYEVDFQDPNRPRTARQIAKYYADIAKSGSVIVNV